MTVVWPVLWPLLVGTVMGMLWRRPVWQRWLAVGGSIVHVGFAVGLLVEAHTHGPVVAALGGWLPPFGIAFVGDRLGAGMTLAGSVVGLGASLYSLGAIDQRREAFGFHPLTQVLMAGVCGAFLTGDFFNLYVWFEVMLLSSFVLLALGGERKQMAGALQYVTVNLVSSATFLIGLGTLYGLVGTLNMADVANRLPGVGQPLAGTVCVLLTTAFGVKAAVFPLYAWLSASYHTPPTVVTAIFAGLLTKVGVYALIRSTVLLAPVSAPFLPPALALVGLLTMVFGVLGAVAQGTFRRVLAIHIVSQIGYMVFALALMTPLGLAAAFFYTVHNMVVKANLFFIGGIAKRLCGTERLAEMGGLSLRSPGLAFLFLASAMSLGGVPPLSGFWAKLFVVQAGLRTDSFVAVGVGLAVGVLTLFSMLKLWNEAFWKAAPEGRLAGTIAVGKGRWLAAPAVGMTVLSIAMGLLAGPVFDFSLAMADELLDPGVLSRAVLGAPP